MLGLRGLLLDVELAVDHFHFLVKSFQRVDSMLEPVDFGLEQLDFLILRICRGGLCARRPGGEDRPDNYRRQQHRQNRQTEFSHLGSPSSFGELPDVRSARGWKLSLSWCSRILPWSGPCQGSWSFDAAAGLVVGRRRIVGEPFVAAATRIGVEQIILRV